MLCQSQILRVSIRSCILRTLLVVLCLGQVIGFLLATEQSALAYADPGSGLLLMQVLGASLAGWIYLMRRKLRSFFSISTHKRTSVQVGIEKPLDDSDDDRQNGYRNNTR